MLNFENVSKSFLIRGKMRPIISNATFTVPFGENYAIVVPAGGGKSTLAALMTGAEQPDNGRIYRYGKLSWMLGGVDGLIFPLTGTENCRYIAMIYGLDPDEVLAFVIDLARIGHYMDMPVRTYSDTLKKRLSLSILLALDFDMYLGGAGPVLSRGDDEFAERVMPLLAGKLEYTPVMLITGDAAGLGNFDGRMGILHDCKLYEFDDFADVQRFVEQEVVVNG